MKLSLQLLLCMAVAQVVVPVPGASAEAAAGTRLALLVDQVSGLDRADAAMLRDRLQRDGLAVEAVTAADLAEPAVLNAERFGGLILTCSPRFPASAFANVMAFLRAGGDLVLLGGRAFSEPVARSGVEWKPLPEVFADFAANPEGRTVLFGFEGGDLSAWTRGAANPEAKSTATAVSGKVGNALCLDLRELGWYDVFGADLPRAVPEGHNALCLWAKADEGTKQLFIEVRERDGARWSRAVDVTPEWRYQVLPPETFLYKSDSTSVGRGGTGDHLRLSNAARVTLGLARDRVDFAGPRHTLWVDEVATCRCDPALARASDPIEFRDLFEDYHVYRLDGATRIRAHAGQDWLPSPLDKAGAVTGWSTVGFAPAREALFLPLLSAEDRHGRSRGWAAGLFLHYAGAYAGSQWAVFGVEGASFYRDPQVLSLLSQVLRAFAGRSWLERARREGEAAVKQGIPLATPPPPGLSIRDGHFITPDGKRFFLIGANFFGSFDTCYGGGVQWDAARLEGDFQRMRRAGINAIRIHGFNRFALDSEPHRLETFLELARRYRVYFLPGVIGHTQNFLEKDAMQAEARRIASLLKDEPMLLGYDLQNEPYWWELAKIRHQGKALGDLFPVPANGWRDYEIAAGLTDGKWTSTFPGVKGPLPVPTDPRLRQAFDGVNGIVGTWIRWQIEAIRSVDRTHPITVGYNTISGCLPANEPLDFVSHHCYEDPLDLEHVRRNLTALDRLKRIWPGRPITLGEFGYSSGDVIGGEVLDVYTQSVGEMAHYLYALANGYDGVMKWQLCDMYPAASWRHAPWWRAKPPQEQVRQGRFGMFFPDGTVEGRPKPIALATRFLREYVDAGHLAGSLELAPAENLIGTSYVFRGERALFVGSSEYRSAGLSFTAAHPANVMLRWDEGEMRILSTADARVAVAPGEFLPPLAENAVAAGKHGGVKRHGKSLTIEMLEGETLVFRAR